MVPSHERVGNLTPSGGLLGEGSRRVKGPTRLSTNGNMTPVNPCASYPSRIKPPRRFSFILVPLPLSRHFVEDWWGRGTGGWYPPCLGGDLGRGVRKGGGGRIGEGGLDY